MTREDVLLLLDAVIADLEHVRDRNTVRGRLPAPRPAEAIAGQLRTVSRDTDDFTRAVQACLDAVADAIERAAERGF